MDGVNISSNLRFPLSKSLFLPICGVKIFRLVLYLIGRIYFTIIADGLVKDTLKVSGKKRGTLKPTLVVLLSLGIFLVVIATASFTGGFEWKMKAMIEHVGETGVLNPDDILGRHTFREVSESTGIKKNFFLEQFHISEEDFDRPIKDSAHREGSGFDTESVRQFVREQLE